MEAHYFSIIKIGKYINNQYVSQWTMFDDYKNICIFKNWEGVLNFLLAYQSMPTLLTYESVNDQNFELKDEELDQKQYELLHTKSEYYQEYFDEKDLLAKNYFYEKE